MEKSLFYFWSCEIGISSWHGQGAEVTGACSIPIWVQGAQMLLRLGGGLGVMNQMCMVTAWKKTLGLD